MGVLRFTFLALSAVAAHASTACAKPKPKPGQSYYPPAANCVEYMVPVSVAPKVIPFSIPHWKTDYELVDFLAAATTRMTNDTGSITGDPLKQPATCQIAASFCSPKKKTDKSKTNSPHHPEKYNFVQHAIGEGYSVFFYDRLGQGSSQKVSGFVNQINIHVDVLKELSKIVRSGEYTKSIGKPSKLVVQGFSFGSYITHAAISTSPEIADGAVLTAIGLESKNINTNGLVRSFVPRIAKLQDKKFKDFDDGYLTWADKYAQINTYFKYPFYDEETADFAESAKQPFGFAEFYTFPSGNGGDYDASNFTGAALAITGEKDYIVCDGNCNGIFEEPARTFFKNAKVFVPHLVPNASHNINFHHNALDAYKVITDFIGANV